MSSAFKVSMTIDGQKEFNAALKRLSKAASGQVLAGAVMDGAFIVQRAAQQNIVAKHIIDTGLLLGSVRSVLIEAKSNFAWAGTGTDVEYGMYHEYGTYKMGARPWLRPAMDENQDRIVRAISVYLRHSLEGVL